MKFEAQHIRHFLGLLGFVVLFSCTNTYVDWTPSFDSKYKHPLGTYILYNELETLFPGESVVRINSNLTDFFEETYYTNSNFIYINEYMDLDSIQQKKLSEWVTDRSIAFLSYSNSRIFKDSIQTRNDTFQNHYYNFKEIAKSDTIYQLYLNDDHYFPHQKYSLKGKILQNYFVTYPQNATVLGTIKLDGKEYPNFIKIPYGGGWYYLHAEPLCFTNIGLLNDEISKYTEDVLSFLPSKTIIWNNYRIQSRKYQQRSEGGMSSMLSFAWKQKPLQTGLLLFFIAGILYILFNSSRRQKIIPYVAPYKNDLLDYSSSLNKVYKKSKNFKYLIRQKMAYFRNMMRAHYYFTQIDFDDEFAQQLHAKSQVPLSECIYLVNYLHEMNTQGYCTYNQFLKLSDLLDDFYIKSKLYGRQ